MHTIPSGEPCFDWTVPDEWSIFDAYVLDPNGEMEIEFKAHNLHAFVGFGVVGGDIGNGCRLLRKSIEILSKFRKWHHLINRLAIAHVLALRFSFFSS